MNRVLFSSQCGVWSTPQDLFDFLDSEFHFDLDACADVFNTKCAKFYDIKSDSLSLPWFGKVFCNPPYGRSISDWFKKACQEVLVGNAECVVMLVPSRTDTFWFHDYVLGCPFCSVRFIRGRLKFGGSKNNAPFPSMICVYQL